MGITPSPACTQKGSRAKASTFIVLLCSRSSIPGRKDLYPKQITEKMMEEQLAWSWFPPSNNCIVSELGGGGVDFSSLDGLQEAQELGKDRTAGFGTS